LIGAWNIVVLYEIIQPAGQFIGSNLAGGQVLQGIALCIIEETTNITGLRNELRTFENWAFGVHESWLKGKAI
jgi:hypothetical protein